MEAFTEEIQFTRKISTANICYHTQGGCRWETIRTSVERSGQSNDALVSATARLGEKGWEAVNTSPGTSEQRQIVLMKRPAPQTTDH